MTVAMSSRNAGGRSSPAYPIEGERKSFSRSFAAAWNSFVFETLVFATWDNACHAHSIAETASHA